MPTRSPFLILTCEHASRAVPPAWRSYFQGQTALLNSHRGYDPGARTLARFLARDLKAPLFEGGATRLLVELNRSLGHPQLFSEVTRRLAPGDKAKLLRCWYDPYRSRIRNEIGKRIAAGWAVVHVSVHTFTPVLKGLYRRGDIGLLHDPARVRETALVREWERGLKALNPAWIVRKNYPYRGTADGFTTYLRSRTRPRDYAGIELEVNQKWFYEGGRDWRLLREQLSESLETMVAG